MKNDVYGKGKQSRAHGGNVVRAAGGPLTSAQRNRLADASFALPDRRYPINDQAHARNALARVSQYGSPEEKATVRQKVRRKYPGIEVSD